MSSAVHARGAAGAAGHGGRRPARARPGAGRDVRALRGQGIGFGYHNHDWELQRKDGARTALELIFEAAEDSPLTWQADVAWLVRGGVEPKAWLNRYRAG